MTPEFRKECEDAAWKASGRAGNLSTFGIVAAGLAFLDMVGWIIAMMQADPGSSQDDVRNLLPFALGSALSLAIVAAVLLGMSSLVDLAGKRLAVEIMRSDPKA